MKTDILTVPSALARVSIILYTILLVVSVVLGVFALTGLRYIYLTSKEITKLVGKQNVQDFLKEPPKVKRVVNLTTLVSIAIFALAGLNGLWFLMVAESINEIMSFYINDYAIAIYGKIRDFNAQDAD